MSTDVIRRRILRELERLRKLQSRGLAPVSCVFSRLEGDSPSGEYVPRFSPIPPNEGRPDETLMVDAAFHPSLRVSDPYLLELSWYATGGGHVTIFSSMPPYAAPPIEPKKSRNRKATPASDNSNSISEELETACQASKRLSPIVSWLPTHVAERLGFTRSIRPDDWAEVVFHLGWHFPDHGIDATRHRIMTTSQEGLPDIRCKELNLQLGEVDVCTDVFPGVIVSRLGEDSDFLTASENALRLILDAMDGIEQSAQPQPHREFGRLRNAFLSHAKGRSQSLELNVQLLRLADSFRTPSAIEWAGFELGGDRRRDMHCYVLSREDANSVVCVVHGPGLQTFHEIADQAGRLLPRWPLEPYPAILNDLRALARYSESRHSPRNTPVEDTWNRGMVTDHRDNVERLLGFVFGTLTRDASKYLALVTWPKDLKGVKEGAAVNAILTLKDMDLFTACAYTIEQSKLIPKDGDKPKPRIHCDASDQTVHLDDNRVVDEMELSLFGFFKAIADVYPNPITFEKIQSCVLGLHGKHPTRDLKNRLPIPIIDWVKSGKNGYYLKLPPPK